MKSRKIKKSKMPPERKRKSKARKRLFSFIKFIFVVGLFSATIVYGAMSPYFNITSITAEPTPHYDANALIAASGILKGSNGFINLFTRPGKFYFLRIGSAEDSIIETLPYVKSAKVRYHLPSKVSIKVVEREAAIVLEVSDKTLLLDKDDYLLEINPKTYDKSLPVIKGISCDKLVPGKQAVIDKDLLLSALNIFDTIKKVDEEYEDKLLPSVDYIDMGDKYNILVSLDSRVIVNIGEAEDLNYKLSTTHAIYNGNIDKNEKGKLDFSVNENPVFTPQ
jgi:hypothetical protein